MTKKSISAAGAPKAVGPYSQAIKAGQFYFLSGQIPIDPATNQIFSGTIEQQTELVLKNAEKILAAAGATLADVVKATIFLADMEDYPKVNGVYARFFPFDPPARSAVQVARLPKDVGIEIELTAYAE
ncbi:MAG: deaminase [Candidatus Abyssobacteria bacterium SURF_5]|uniref:Deaminase n=1 Tax=Abyssobacteria bacterium (strain SURF_5) TaxID=2093360 RepID=A0A3A4NSY4_ABYX5|nr:MAG: deaminase [Candidatus Abyssubacteria bacterium SURF_5]